MKFARIEMLYWIWILPVLLLICLHGMRRRRRILDGFARGKSREALSADADSTRRGMQGVLIFIGILFLILSLTGPQYGFLWEEVEQKGVDIIIALDCSKSMLATDIAPSRLDRAKREVKDLLSMLKGDRVGLVAFAGTAFLQCPLTIDYQAFYLFLDTLKPDFLPVGGTEIQEALRVSLSGFNQKESSDKAVILITDGENTGKDPSGGISEAKKAGIKIFTIGVGGETGVPVPSENGGLTKDGSGKIVVTRLDEDLLRKIARDTDGIYVRSVAGDMDLTAIYEKEIRGKMEATTVTSGKRQVWKDRFQWLLVLAVAAFLVECFLPVAIKKKAPGLGLVLVLGLMLATPSTGFAESAFQEVQKGMGAYDQGDYEAALKHFIDAQLKEPDQPEIYYNIGNTYYKLGDFGSAWKNYAEALKSPNKEIQEKTRYNMGNARFRKNQLKEAISEYEAALKLGPEDQQARDNLEFAKKKMEEQKQQQKSQDGSKDGSKNQDKNQNKKQDRDQNQPKEEGDQNKAGDKEQSEDQNSSDPGKTDQQKKEEENQSGSSDSPSRPQYGKEMDTPSDEAGDSGDQPENKDEQGLPKPQTDESQGASEKEMEKQQAERMLNRLKDRPGRALIPAYKPGEVEKDW
ncbi:MAG: VWA domain-containing protein [Proteobacteria bacterium]|nr:VWA domain-containing protein [Pseudomonadota bacterium]MBU4469641.1 VWA domain-containing protein [Pseudomonadota bacterium]MCG2751724.1 VWA domain-containing protein [Desulfobacteraceae bacterium]